MTATEHSAERKVAVEHRDSSGMPKPVSRCITNVVHITSWLSRQGGGIPAVIWSLSRQTKEFGIESCVAGLKDQWNKQDIPDSIEVLQGTILGPKAFGFSSDLGTQARAQVSNRSILHVHGLWMYPGILARKLARRASCPLVISPHGMLEPWALSNSPLKKRLAALTFEKTNLRSADCLHALCAAEAENFRAYGLRNPVAVIPNGMDLGMVQTMATRDALRRRFPVIGDRQCVLFLSRLHPKKGIENLLEAWRGLTGESRNWCLLIAGAGSPDYEKHLRVRKDAQGLGDDVIFLGPMYGAEKKDTLAAADIYILPSFSEGFSMAILEAAAAGLPVVQTRECNFPELTSAGGAIEVAPEPEGIRSGLLQLMQLSKPERQEMGRRGRELVERSYTWPVQTRKMLEVYEWVAGRGERPGFVIE
jgi:poly(glycerol-phosphate) alpha-glucosyltransferase